MNGMHGQLLLRASPVESKRAYGVSCSSRRSANTSLIDGLPRELIVYAMSAWDAATVAQLVVTSHACWELKGDVVDEACARLGYSLPPRRSASDSLTQRLHFVQCMAARTRKRLATGSARSLCIVKLHELLSWGEFQGPMPVCVRMPSVCVTEVAAGDTHCLVLTLVGSVLSWGEDNCYGQLG